MFHKEKAQEHGELHKYHAGKAQKATDPMLKHYHEAKQDFHGDHARWHGNAAAGSPDGREQYKPEKSFHKYVEGLGFDTPKGQDTKEVRQ